MALSQVVSPLKVESIDLGEIISYLCVIAKVSRGEISITISTGRDIAILSRGEISKTMSTGRDIATLSIGGSFKPRSEILQNVQEVEYIKQRYRQRY